MINRFYLYIQAPVSAAPLAVFRVLFGFLMLISTLRFMYLGWIEDQYTNPMFHFTYYGFDWVKPLGVQGMYLVFVGMAVSTLGIMLGLFYRINALLFFLLFTYVELLDKTYYLNHYYFVSIVSFLLVLVPANVYFSVDAVLFPKLLHNQVPRWMVGVFRLQIGLVYFYAGIAKLNYDWMINALPLKIWLPAHDQLFLIGPFLKYPETAYLFSWFGMFYDTTIPFFLLWRKTRFFAYLTVIAFHWMTGLLFQIGMFPLIMILITPIFFPATFHQKVIGFLSKIFYISLPQTRKTLEINAFKRNFLLGILLIHCIIQLLFPWRYLLYPGNLFWTEEGYRFSWRVMLMEKAGTATFYVKDSQTGKEGIVVNQEFLNAHQEKQMSMQPDMILQFAHFLADYYAKKGVYKPQVRAEVYVTLNARKSSLLIDPQIDLTQKQDTWLPKDWILPWKE